MMEIKTQRFCWTNRSDSAEVSEGGDIRASEVSGCDEVESDRQVGVNTQVWNCPHTTDHKHFV